VIEPVVIVAIGVGFMKSSDASAFVKLIAPGGRARGVLFLPCGALISAEAHTDVALGQLQATALFEFRFFSPQMIPSLTRGSVPEAARFQQPPRVDQAAPVTELGDDVRLVLIAQRHAQIDLTNIS
jgi:cobalamin biosynthesis protein CbiG